MSIRAVIQSFFSLLLLISSALGVEADVNESREEIFYARRAVVLEINGDEMVLEDDTENLWAYAIGDFTEGQTVMLLMSDCGTKTIYDDEVLEVLPVAVVNYHDFENLYLDGGNELEKG